MLGGGAWAANNLKKNSVGSKQIKDGAVELKDIDKDARTSLAGQDGAPGANGAPGAPGANGTSIVAKASSTGPVTTLDNVPVTIPLTGNTWTATATELNQLPLVGKITYTPPTVGGPGCDGDGFASLLVSIEVNGQEVASGAPRAIPNGVQHTGGIGALTVTIPEPGATKTRTAVVKISDTCSNPGDNFQINSVSFEVAGLR